MASNMLSQAGQLRSPHFSAVLSYSANVNTTAEDLASTSPLRRATSRSDSTTGSRDIYTTVHGTCPKCHHFHDASWISFRVDSKSTQSNTIRCSNCGRPWFGLGGFTTRMSLLSQETLLSFRQSLEDCYPPSIAPTSPRRTSTQLEPGADTGPAPSGQIRAGLRKTLSSGIQKAVDNTPSNGDAETSSPLESSHHRSARNQDQGLRGNLPKTGVFGPHIKANRRRVLLTNALRSIKTLLGKPFRPNRELVRPSNDAGSRTDVSSQPTTSAQEHVQPPPTTQVFETEDDGADIASGPRSPHPSSYLSVNSDFDANEDSKRRIRRNKTLLAKRRNQQHSGSCPCRIGCPNCTCDEPASTSDSDAVHAGNRFSSSISQPSVSRVPSPSRPDHFFQMGMWAPQSRDRFSWRASIASSDTPQSNDPSDANPRAGFVPYPPCPSPPVTSSRLLPPIRTSGSSKPAQPDTAQESSAAIKTEESEDPDQLHDSAVDIEPSPDSHVTHASTWPPSRPRVLY